MQLTFARTLIVPAALAIVACSSSSGSSATGSSVAALMVVHTRTAIVTLPVDDTNSTDVRSRVDAFYPSICLDVDEDGDGVPDTIDVHQSGEDSADDEATHGLDHRCQPCNRGPGKADDFRLKTQGSQAELDRGRVFQRADDGTITVPSPDGPITITVTSSTQIKDGEPRPGSDIRVKGAVGSGTRTIVAAELDVLCPGPAPVGDGQIPPGTQPAPTDPPPAACEPSGFRCGGHDDCCAGLTCNVNAAGDGVCGPIR